MANCLGLYIQDNLIKYAKISKDANLVKVEAFGITFYEDLAKTIEQIIKETYSYQTPICINLENVNYTYSELFSLLAKNDFKNAMATEFDIFCSDHAKNIKAIEYRTIQNVDLNNPDKNKIIYAYTDKANVVESTIPVNQYKVNYISPISLAITNLREYNINTNSMIVNIENKTEVTTIVAGKVYRVDKIEDGVQSILQNIAVKENSQAKAYEICKNTTIYTTATQDLQTDENMYLEEIMPTIYNIIKKVENLITDNKIEIENVYITGLAMAINNVDLFFQENLPHQKCEILLPYFIEKNNTKINIKDYIEVNSAIALGMQGVGFGQREFNFQTEKRNLWEILNGDVKQPPSFLKNKISLKDLFKSDLKTDLDLFEKTAIRGIATVLMIFILYFAFSYITDKNLNIKKDQANDIVNDTNTKISQITKYKQLVDAKKDSYQSALDELDELKNKTTGYNEAIPLLLNKIMTVVPKEVQILSIENASGTTVTIQARTKQYEYLGYLKAKLSNDGILTNVTSTTGTKQDGYIKVTINGNLPNY